MIKDFQYARALARFIAKKQNLKNQDDWNKYTQTKHFADNFANVLPKRPDIYYRKPKESKA